MFHGVKPSSVYVDKVIPSKTLSLHPQNQTNLKKMLLSHSQEGENV